MHTLGHGCSLCFPFTSCYWWDSSLSSSMFQSQLLRFWVVPTLLQYYQHSSSSLTPSYSVPSLLHFHSPPWSTHRMRPRLCGCMMGTLDTLTRMIRWQAHCPIPGKPSSIPIPLPALHSLSTLWPVYPA